MQDFVSNTLLPQLNDGDWVILDNAKIHKSEEFKALFAGTGVRPVYLPAYSPELNPVCITCRKNCAVARTYVVTSSKPLLPLVGVTLVGMNDGGICKSHLQSVQFYCLSNCIVQLYKCTAR